MKNSKETPKTFKELFANTNIEPTTDESGNIVYNFKATLKEKPKQEENEIIDISDHDGIGNAVDNLNNEPPQETTIEEIRKYAELSYYNGDEINAFVNGAKWQQERSYSEEDLISFAHFYFKEEFNSTMQTSKSTYEILQDWFKQFKKK